MKLRGFFLLLFAGGLAGCQTPELPEYTVSRDSLFHLQQIEPAQVSVAAFTGGPSTLGGSSGADVLSGCSLITKDEPGIPQDPAAYIRLALVEELTAAGHYSEQGATRIAGEVEHLSFGRGVPFGGGWEIALRLTSSTGAEMRVEEEYDFDSGAVLGPTVCSRAVEWFEPAVRALLEKAIRSPEFRPLIGMS